MRQILVLNSQAKQLQKKRKIRPNILRQFADHFHIIDEAQASRMIESLDQRQQHHAIESVYIVGGDGTYNLVLNWVMQQPVNRRPSLVSVGGGEFCYMTGFHGFNSRNPVKNLTQIISGRVQLIKKKWAPVRMVDSATHTVRHAAVFANGIICDILEWYEHVGKGGLMSVARVVTGAILSVVSETIRRLSGRIKLLEGHMQLGDKVLAPKEYAGFTFAAVPELMTTCRPFRGTPCHPEFAAITYWGSLKRLAISTPFIWFGGMPPWLRDTIFNRPILQAVVTTTDSRLVIDGDLVVLNSIKPGEKRVLTFTATEQIPLLIVASN